MATPDPSRGRADAEAIPGSRMPGPFAVGEYAARLRDRLREFTRVQLVGEVTNLGRSRAKTYFELRDERGAVPCSMWNSDFDALGLPPGALADGAQVVVGGGADYYPGTATSSPAFSFAVTQLRIAGEGDLLARIERLRRALHAEGLLAPQKVLPRPALPRTIGVVTGEGGKARDDVLAGLRRRGWQGRLLWAFAPVQDRHAAPAITRALTDLAAAGSVDVIIVARGGGSVTDLLAFSDETLCRTVALLRVPVIASVGHHTDRTLLDDVAACACSTPTHAAEQAVPVHVGEARAALAHATVRLQRHGRRAVVDRARELARLSRAPAEHVARHRARLHQSLRELRAAGRRRVAREYGDVATAARTLDRRAQAAAGADLARRARELDHLAALLAAHDPERTVARGYALVRDDEGELVTSAEQAAAARSLTLRFADGEAGAAPDGSIVPRCDDG
ncbi:MAG: exodeoxyribonuclease VII large subunit [Solirubrobacteraceae bacterium]|nr:exodeoxyribonuclease VII large subunit [Solirubrobacteraceae bacterium]